MSPPLKSSLAALTLGLAYAFLFHHAELGLNLFLFDALLIGLALWLRPELGKHQSFVWSVGGLLFAAGSVVVVHGWASIWAHHLTFFLVLGFAQARELRFVWFALLMGLAALFEAPLRQARRWRALRRQRDEQQTSVALPWLKQLALPAMIVVPFFALYLAANAEFAAGMDALLGVFDNVHFSRQIWWNFWLTIFGTLLTLGFFFPRIDVSRLVKYQLGFQDYLVRKPKNRLPAPSTAHKNTSLHLRPRPKNLALKTEYRQAVLTFGLLNLLLAAVNATDLRFVWLASGELPAATLSQYVHTGTWNLLFSIVLAIVVVLYFYRGNLNFLQDNALLAPLARFWIIQNGLLALSVAVRNWHYIDAYGLALGRVQIAFVLLLMLFGLYTLFRKISHRLSLTYLLQTNGMAAWLCLLLFAAVNWSCVVTRYNLATQTHAEIDWDNLRQLPPDNTFLLTDHPSSYLINQRRKDVRQGGFADWRSWNYAGWRNLRKLE